MSVVSYVQQRETVCRLHDGVAKVRRIERDLTVIVNAQTGKDSLDIFPEPGDRSIEIEEALRRTNQIFVPNGAKGLQRKVEQQPLGDAGTWLEDGLLKKSTEDLCTVYLDIPIDKDTVHVVVEIKRVLPLQKAFELSRPSRCTLIVVV